jgi:hypothetical protein
MATPKKLSLSLVLAALAVGCGNGPQDPTGSSSSSLSAYAEPLPTLSDEQWVGVTAGCEGRLHGEETFGITRRDALVVAKHEEAAVCVDTLEAIMLELEDLGDVAAADSLYAGFYEAVQLSQVEHWATPTSAPAQGDPNPQPNVPRHLDERAPEPTLGGDVRTSLGPPMGDPNPQPNSPTEGDPNPQPNTPTGMMGQPTPTP